VLPRYHIAWKLPKSQARAIEIRNDFACVCNGFAWVRGHLRDDHLTGDRPGPRTRRSSRRIGVAARSKRANKNAAHPKVSGFCISYGAKIIPRQAAW
jgi:hypothetical protein